MSAAASFRSAVLLIASLLAIVLYAGSPMYYTYFQGGALIAKHLPSWVLDRWPFRLWGDIAEIYEPQRFASLKLGDIACRLQKSSGVEATRSSDGSTTCRYLVPKGEGLYGPYLQLPGGSYAVSFDFAIGPGCEGGTVRADVAAGGGKVTLATTEAAVPPSSRVTLHFRVDGAARILQGIETRAKSEAGCFLLNSLDLKRTD